MAKESKADKYKRELSSATKTIEELELKLKYTTEMYREKVDNLEGEAFNNLTVLNELKNALKIVTKIVDLA